MGIRVNVGNGFRNMNVEVSETSGLRPLAPAVHSSETSLESTVKSNSSILENYKRYMETATEEFDLEPLLSGVKGSKISTIYSYDRPDVDISRGYDKSFESSNGKKYSLYNQYMSGGSVIGYSSLPIYGSDRSDNIGAYGCSIVSLTTILSGQGSTLDPGQVVKETESIMLNYRLGSTQQLEELFKFYGYNTSMEENYRGDADSVNQSIEKLRTHLQNGGEATLLSSYGQSKYDDGTYGYQTKAGHWVSAIGISDDGNYVYISDPAGDDGWSRIEDVFNQGATQTGKYILVSK